MTKNLTTKLQVSGLDSKRVSMLEPGDIVSCEECDADVLLVLKKPEMGQMDYPSCFKPIQNVKRGSLTICEKCGGHWGGFSTQKPSPMLIHIRGKGWVL